MNLSNPAYVAAVSYLVLVIVILFAPRSVGMQGNETDKPPTFLNKLFSVMILLIPFALSVYSINCFVVGGCRVWSWVNAIMILLWVLLLVLLMVLGTKKE